MVVAGLVGAALCSGAVNGAAWDCVGRPGARVSGVVGVVGVVPYDFGAARSSCVSRKMGIPGKAGHCLPLRETGSCPDIDIGYGILVSVNADARAAVETTKIQCLSKTENWDSGKAERSGLPPSICVPTAQYYHASSGMSLYSRQYAMQLHETPSFTLTGCFRTNCAIF